MKIIFFSHPEFIESRSMEKYTIWLSEGMKRRGHETEVWAPISFFQKLTSNLFLKKWFGYIDQYILFPLQVKRRLKSTKKSLYVFTDHALGPWIPIVKNEKSVVHCHDFLAQRSALKLIPENRIGITGKIYQSFIRHGYIQAKNFISVSRKTQEDLHSFLGFKPTISEVIYNGLNQRFDMPNSKEYACKEIFQSTGLNLQSGFILHVGGNQWYKNRLGVVDIYTSWRQQYVSNIPLCLVGTKPNIELIKKIADSPYHYDIFQITGIDDKLLRSFYSAASLLLFPSLNEGFGWPIAEAMASGCLVITTALDPMQEVGGDAAFYITRRPAAKKEAEVWALKAAQQLDTTLWLQGEEKQKAVQAGLMHVEKFDAEKALDRIEKVYQEVMQS